jgi:hypothetical protein
MGSGFRFDVIFTVHDAGAAGGVACAEAVDAATGITAATAARVQHHLGVRFISFTFLSPRPEPWQYRPIGNLP